MHGTYHTDGSVSVRFSPNELADAVLLSAVAVESMHPSEKRDRFEKIHSDLSTFYRETQSGE